MYEYQRGITSAGAKGNKDFILQPVPGGDFTSLKGSFESSYGLIKASWMAKDGKLSSYASTVPDNTTATFSQGSATAESRPPTARHSSGVA